MARLKTYGSEVMQFVVQHFENIDEYARIFRLINREAHFTPLPLFKNQKSSLVRFLFSVMMPIVLHFDINVDHFKIKNQSEKIDN